jgi:hypothetical protein
MFDRHHDVMRVQMNQLKEKFWQGFTLGFSSGLVLWVTVNIALLVTR